MSTDPPKHRQRDLSVLTKVCLEVRLVLSGPHRPGIPRHHQRDPSNPTVILSIVRSVLIHTHFTSVLWDVNIRVLPLGDGLVDSPTRIHTYPVHSDPPTHRQKSPSILTVTRSTNRFVTTYTQVTRSTTSYRRDDTSRRSRDLPTPRRTQSCETRVNKVERIQGTLTPVPRCPWTYLYHLIVVPESLYLSVNGDQGSSPV